MSLCYFEGFKSQGTRHVVLSKVAYLMVMLTLEQIKAELLLFNQN